MGNNKNREDLIGGFWLLQSVDPESLKETIDFLLHVFDYETLRDVVVTLASEAAGEGIGDADDDDDDDDVLFDEDDVISDDDDYIFDEEDDEYNEFR